MSSNSDNENKTVNVFTVKRYVPEDFCLESNDYETEIHKDEFPLLSKNVKIITKFDTDDKQKSYVSKRFIIPEQCINNSLVTSKNQLPLHVEIHFNFTTVLAEEVQNFNFESTNKNLSPFDKIPSASHEQEKNISTPQRALIEQRHSNLPNEQEKLPGVPSQQQPGMPGMLNQQQPGMSRMPNQQQQPGMPGMLNQQQLGMPGMLNQQQLGMPGMPNQQQQPGMPGMLNQQQPGMPRMPNQQQQPGMPGMLNQQQPGMPGMLNQQQPGMLRMPNQQQPGMPNQQHPGMTSNPLKTDLKEDNKKRCFCC